MADSYPRSFVKDYLIVTLGVVLFNIKAILMMPLVIKTVGPTVYGGFILLSSFLGIIFGISSLGVGFKAKRYLPSATGLLERRELFFPQFFFQLVSLVALSCFWMLSDHFINAHIFKGETSYSPLIIPAYLICFFMYSQGSDYFRYTSRLPYMTVVSIAFAYIDPGFALAFFLRFKYMSVNVLILSQAASAFIVAVPCCWVIAREIGIGCFLYRWENLLSEIRMGFPLILNFIVDFILAASDRYLIAIFLNVSAVGYYTPGYVVGSLMIFIPKAMGGVLPQLLSKAVDAGKPHEAQRVLNYAIKIFLILAIPFVFGSAILGRGVLNLLANNEVADRAWMVAPIVAAGILFYGLNMILFNVFFVLLRTEAIFKMNLFAAAFNFIMNLILLHFIKNIQVAAWTTLLSYLIAFLVAYRMIAKDWPVDFEPVVIVKSVMASAVMCALLFWLPGHAGGVGMLVLKVILGVAAYFGGLLVFRAFSEKELRFARNWVFYGFA